MNRIIRGGVCVLLAALAVSCARTEAERADNLEAQRANIDEQFEQRESILDLFANDGDPDRQINVNKHLWAASLDILSFLPIEAADPFTGIIVTDWGRVSGAATPYRVTVYVQAPALEAQSLRVAVFRQAGGRSVPVSDEIADQIEDAILTRARQLRTGN